MNALMFRKHVYAGLAIIAALAESGGVLAQQASGSGAVEEFSPQLDAAYMMRPRVGLYGITELMMAALEANIDEVARLIAQGANLEEQDVTGGTPLMWAVQGGSIDVVNLLIDKGADVGATGGRNATAFMIAVISGKEDIGIRLLDAGATFSGELSYQQDYLEYAAANGQATMVDALLEHGADIEESGPDALCLAISSRHADVARVLIEAGVDVNRAGSAGNDLPMIHALKARDESIVRLLLDNGAELDRKDKAGRVSIMYYATQTKNAEIVSLLLDHGATIDTLEADQLLNSAIYQGSMEMADLFVDRGASISTSHVFAAVSRKHFNMADEFIEAVGVDTIDDYLVDRLIDTAASSGHSELAEKLLDLVDSRKRPLRLLYETTDADQCRLNSRDPADPAVDDTVVTDYDCNAELFIAERSRDVFVLQGNRIDVYPLDDESRRFSLTLPEPEIEARLDEIRDRFTQQFGGTHDWVSAKVATIGYLDNGYLALVTHTSGPADGTYASLFTWDGRSWALTGTQDCHRFDWICHMPGVDGRSIDRWPLRRTVWHAALQRNPGFVAKTSPDDGNWTGTVVFDFDGRRSELGYELQFGDHCSDECTFTTAVDIRPPDAATVRFELANSRVSIAEQYMLAKPHNEGTRLYDLRTGEDVLGRLRRAAWIH
jgi:ankyrin repeat protein